MQTRNVLAVATSVSMKQGFDTLDTLAYAIDHGFTGVQVYIDEKIINDAKVREHVRAICEDNHLALIAHAPAIPQGATISVDAIHSATRDLLALESKALVVHHFDETVSLEETLKWLRDLQNRGFLPCLENFFTRGGETSKDSFLKYLNLLRRAKADNIELMPVFDIPRLYDSHVKLAHMAEFLIDEAFDVFESLETPVIFHLIDTLDAARGRSSWCPIGQGIIPYPQILQQLKRHKIPVCMVVLEFEDKINPLESKQFLEEHLPQRGIP